MPLQAAKKTTFQFSIRSTDTIKRKRDSWRFGEVVESAGTDSREYRSSGMEGWRHGCHGQGRNQPERIPETQRPPRNCHEMQEEPVSMSKAQSKSKSKSPRMAEGRKRTWRKASVWGKWKGWTCTEAGSQPHCRCQRCTFNVKSIHKIQSAVTRQIARHLTIVVKIRWLPKKQSSRTGRHVRNATAGHHFLAAILPTEWRVQFVTLSLSCRSILETKIMGLPKIQIKTKNNTNTKEALLIDWEAGGGGNRPIEIRCDQIRIKSGYYYRIDKHRIP